MSRLHEAAMARAAQVAQRSDRPARRRSAEQPSAAVVRASAGVELRAKQDDADRLSFHGVASVTERAYEMWDWYGPYTEIVSAGAFTETLARADLDVPLVLNHDSMRRIARTTTGTLFLTETDEGLDVLAPDLDPTDADVAYILPKLRAGLIDEMSFMFRIDAGQWSPDYTEYRIERVDLHRGDVAIVGYGANPFTFGEARTAPAIDVARVAAAFAFARV